MGFSAAVCRDQILRGAQSPSRQGGGSVATSEPAHTPNRHSRRLDLINRKFRLKSSTLTYRRNGWNRHLSNVLKVSESPEHAEGLQTTKRGWCIPGFCERDRSRNVVPVRRPSKLTISIAGLGLGAGLLHSDITSYKKAGPGYPAYRPGAPLHKPASYRLSRSSILPYVDGLKSNPWIERHQSLWTRNREEATNLL